MKVKFPSDFLWGTAISAFQTEMGSEKEKIPQTDWLLWAKSKEIASKGLVSGDNPEDGDGFWSLYEEDMKRAKELGTNSIRLSIEWARIFPASTSNVEAAIINSKNGDVLEIGIGEASFEGLSKLANWEAVEHYKKMFAYAKSLGLKVFLTLYHWPLPAWLHDPVGCHNDIEKCEKKGWLDRATIIEFGKYAHFAARVFDDYVDLWETINEPDVISSQGYLLGLDSGFPPGLSDVPLNFQVQRNLAFAHNVAYSALKKHSSKPVGIGFALTYFVSAESNPKSKRVAEFARYMTNEWYLNAIMFGTFDNDFDMISDERVDGLRGTDFIGIDYYTRVKVRYNNEAPFDTEVLPCEDCTDFGWDIYPEGIRKVSNWIFEKYRVPIYILENGIADSSDSKRGKYISTHIKELWKAINLDGLPIKGYYHWSLIDNFEWAKGYSMRFGLFEVDYKTKERRERESAKVYEAVCKTGEIEI